MAEKKPLDLFRVAYGIGAAILLIGTMFKFLGLEGANTLFIVGILTEAIIFAISAFQKDPPEKEYNWENVFPQLAEGDGAKLDVAKSFEAYHKSTETIVKSVETLNTTLDQLNSITNNLSQAVQKIDVNVSNVEKRSAESEKELQELREKLARMNEFYNEMLEVLRK